MKAGLGDIIGKTVTHVLVANKKNRPKNQVFIVFNDSTYLELYGEDFTCASGLNQGDVYDAVRYVGDMEARIVKIYGKNVIKNDDK